MENRSRGWRSEAAKSLCATHGADDPVSIILRLAEQLVADTGLSRPAKNLKILASFQDIIDIQECQMPDAGRLVPTERGLVVQVNASHLLPKRNFSACHEIGHTLIPSFHDAGVLQRRIDLSTGEFNVDEEEEFLCDVAASEILLPTGEFLAAAPAQPLRFEILPYLASEFEASLEATANKLVRSGLANVAVIVWEMAWTPTQKRTLVDPGLSEGHGAMLPPRKLRVRYAQCGGALARCFFPKSKSVPDGSLIHQAYAGSQIVRGEQSLFSGGKEELFYTESQGFGNRDPGSREDGKVMTLVFERR